MFFHFNKLDKFLSVYMKIHLVSKLWTDFENFWVLNILLGKVGEWVWPLFRHMHYGSNAQFALLIVFLELLCHIEFILYYLAPETLQDFLAYTRERYFRYILLQF